MHSRTCQMLPRFRRLPLPFAHKEAVDNLRHVRYGGSMAPHRTILQRLAEPDAVEFVRRSCASDPDLHRTELVDRLCDQFGLHDPLGRGRRTGCLKALRTLEAKGYFRLPPPRAKTAPGAPRRAGSSVAPAAHVPDTAGAIHDLTLVLVQSDEQMRIWNELFETEHPRGAGPLVGRQLRYLIGSAHGWLGGAAFASAALHLQDRDRWIGWDQAGRLEHLDRVVGLSRYLIRPSVVCRNLASHVLGLLLHRLPQDFERRYGYQPWLVETFVDESRHAGTSYRAANWTRIGRTQGGRRRGRGGCRQETQKAIYVYPLVDDFRVRMGVPLRRGLGALPLAAGLEGRDWAEYEFGGAPLGDRRLSRRLVVSAALQAENPGRAFCGLAQGTDAMIKGYYRFIEQPETDDSAVTAENILRPHREQTLRRMRAHKTVLCIQDGTDLNYNDLAQCEGLGVIGGNQTKAKTRGLHLHSTLAVTDEGLPLGVLRADCTAPQPRDPADQRTPAAIPLEEKKSYSWVEGLRDCAAIAAELPQTEIVCVMDREADFFELFDAWREDPRIELVVRADHNRCTTEDLKLFDAVKASEPQLVCSLHLTRQSVRPKKSKQQARPGRPERTAEMTLRYRRIELKPPNYHREKEPLALSIVHAVEATPPAGEKPVEWFLLTSQEVGSPDQARTVLERYCLRWRIEDWHRVLKSGCKVEELQHETAERLRRAVAIKLVIAWRVLLLTLLGRETPDLSPEVFFSDLEVEFLTAYAKHRRLPPPTTLGAAVFLVSKIGGYMARKSDPPPGSEIMWRGYADLRTMCLGYAVRAPEP